VEILDISVPVRPGMVTYPGDPPVVLERVRSIADGDGYNLSRLDFGLHSGTHVDAPLHFVDGGAAAESLVFDALIGPAVVLDVTPAEGAIRAVDLDGLPSGAERVLLKTSNSELWARASFSPEFVSLDAGGARALVEGGVLLVGIDYLSIGDEEAHVVLLEAGVVALEGLDLRAVEPGEYQLVCAPLKLAGAEGAPARALLIRDGV
jgi:arylformamidase